MEVVIKFWLLKHKSLDFLNHNLTIKSSFKKTPRLNNGLKSQILGFWSANRLDAHNKRAVFPTCCSIPPAPDNFTMVWGSSLMVSHVSLHHHSTTRETFGGDSPPERWVPPPPSPSCGGRSLPNKSLTPARLPRRFKPPLSIVHLLEVRHKARKAFLFTADFQTCYRTCGNPVTAH